MIAALWDATDKRKTPIDESTEHKMIELFYERSKPEDTVVESKPATYTFQFNKEKSMIHAFRSKIFLRDCLLPLPLNCRDISLNWFQNDKCFYFHGDKS